MGETLHRLNSGLYVAQDIRDAVRFPIFQHDDADGGASLWSNGGNVFLVAYDGRPYGITCNHVIPGQHDRLIISHRRHGNNPAGIEAIHTLKERDGHKPDSDAGDIAVIAFHTEYDLNFFDYTPFILESSTLAAAEPGDELFAFGALWNDTVINGTSIEVLYTEIGLEDDTKRASTDSALRRAFNNDFPAHRAVTGLSGAPVFNVSRNGLSGIVCRGSAKDSRAIVHYIDVQDIVRLVHAARYDEVRVSYTKVRTSWD
jgi:hypothetical protein